MMTVDVAMEELTCYQEVNTYYVLDLLIFFEIIYNYFICP